MPRVPRPGPNRRRRFVAEDVPMSKTDGIGSSPTSGGWPNSAATKPACIGRPIRPRTSPRGNGWRKNSPRPGSIRSSTASAMCSAITSAPGVSAGRLAQRDAAARRLARRRARRHLRARSGARSCRRPVARRGRGRGGRLGRRGGPLRQYARQPLVHRHARGTTRLHAPRAATAPA